MTSIDLERYDLELAAARERSGSLDLATPAHELYDQAAAKVRGLGVGQSVRHAGHRIARSSDAYHVSGPSGTKAHFSPDDAVRQVVNHQRTAELDADAKARGRFVAKLSNARPADADAHQDVAHPSGNGAKVRVFGNGQQMVEDSKGHTSYHDDLESAAHAAGQDDAGARLRRYPSDGYGGGGPSMLSQVPFDGRRFTIALASALAPPDPDDTAEKEGSVEDILEDAVEDAQKRLARLRRAGRVDANVLKAAELAVSEAQSALDAYRARPVGKQLRVNQDV